MRRAGWLIPILMVASLVSCDHATKDLATNRLKGIETSAVIPDVLHFTYAENHDVAFSLLRWIPPGMRQGLIVGVGCMAIGLLAFIWWRRSPTRLRDRAAYVLMLAGALGNLLDRVVHGYVVDFIHLPGWPVFNAADVFILVGIALFMLSFRRSRLQRPAQSRVEYGVPGH